MAFAPRIIFIVIDNAMFAAFDSAIILFVPVIKRFTDRHIRICRIYLYGIPKRQMRIIDCKRIKSRKPRPVSFRFIGRNIPAGFLILYKSIVSPPNLMKQNNRIFTARFIQFAMFISTLNNKFPCILCILVTKLITKIQVGTYIRQSSYNSGNDLLRIKKYQMRDCRRLSFAFVDNRSIRGILFHSPLSQTFLLIFGIRYGNYLAKIYAFLFRIIAFRILR